MSALPLLVLLTDLRESLHATQVDALVHCGVTGSGRSYRKVLAKVETADGVLEGSARLRELLAEWVLAYHNVLPTMAEFNAHVVVDLHTLRAAVTAWPPPSDALLEIR